MTDETKRTLAWWFCAPYADGVVRLPHGDGRRVKVGETLSVEGPIIACQSGLHASVRAIDALQYAPGATICRVEVWGDVQQEHDKIAGRYRKVLWMADADKALRLFACDCAERVVHLCTNDTRTREALAVARRFAAARAAGAAWAARASGAAERQWQGERLLAYLRGEVTP